MDPPVTDPEIVDPAGLKNLPYDENGDDVSAELLALRRMQGFPPLASCCAGENCYETGYVGNKQSMVEFYATCEDSAGGLGGYSCKCPLGTEGNGV